MKETLLAACKETESEDPLEVIKLLLAAATKMLENYQKLQEAHDNQEG